MAIQPTRQVRRSVSHRWDKDLKKALSRKREALEEEADYKRWSRETDLYRLVRELVSVKTNVPEKSLQQRYEKAKDALMSFKHWWGEFTSSEKLHIRECVFFNNPEKRFTDYSLRVTAL